MRVISQDRSTDYPYDKSVVFLDPYNENNVKIQLAGDKECFMLGKYSTKEKALKAMELLREAYLKFAHATNGNNFYTFFDNPKVFLFPADDEVKV